jgi:hypothetical protein
VQRDPRIWPANLPETVISADRQWPELAEAGKAPVPTSAASDEDPLARARGVLLGSAIGAGIWIAVGLAVWLLS